MSEAFRDLFEPIFFGSRQLLWFFDADYSLQNVISNHLRNPSLPPRIPKTQHLYGLPLFVSRIPVLVLGRDALD